MDYGLRVFWYYVRVWVGWVDLFRWKGKRICVNGFAHRISYAYAV